MARRMKEHELVSPVDLPGEPIGDGDPLAWTTVTIAVAALVLLFANAGTLSAWVDEKPVSQRQQRASELAAGWKATMDGIGITAPRDALHARWKQVQAKRFGEEAPAGTQ
ncbi:MULTISPECIES: hypothetical protein [unclassified Sphingomonas]|uniref:hypothetical protein n=1 Tax=unclassified Sphingomonas TaxID=196159 RepID=UPI0006F4840D|nr:MULTISPECIES: hypothetical protein [unclassified Sphingomonas]KQX20723.1 hypothetical protein ASD17_07435 [Sphingomonas sp. Root1294]KQY68569.1 hypothetical protein ASD39_03955 [Sphingomonas sp. Root50]KRB87975.1 hypothetical protein ASE22_21130 [Sphingomonas sp. Root720]